MNAMNILEWTATLFGFACVWLTIVENIWCWPTGLVSVIAFIVVFNHAKLYSDVILQLINIPLQAYGWYYWVRGGPRDNAAPITRLRMWEIGVWLITSAVGTAVFGFMMHRWTDAALPYWDTAIMALSLVAQYLLSRKVLENWPFWVAVDVLAIGVYAYKGLYVTTGLYSVFLIMAISGWVAWHRSYVKQTIFMGRGFEVVAD